jgi:hypothetical protein
MVFAIVLQWKKTVFLGLKQFSFGKSSLLSIVQAIVRIVRDCTVSKGLVECVLLIGQVFICRIEIFCFINDFWHY